jgi:hypothetical protein
VLLSVGLAAGLTATPALAAAAPPRPSVPPPAAVVQVASSHGHLITPGLSGSGALQRHPGLLTIRLLPSQDEGTVSLVRLHPGYSVAQYRSDSAHSWSSVAAELRTAQRADHLGGLDLATSQVQTFTSLLLPGTYYLVDNVDGPPEMHPVRVSGTPELTRPPRLDGFAILRRNTLLAPDVLPRSGHLLVASGDRGTHLVCLDQVRPATTKAEVLAYFADPSGPPTFATGAAGCTATASPGVAFAISYSRPAGRYVMFDPRPDPEAGGTPYAAEGAVHLVTLR